MKSSCLATIVVVAVFHCAWGQAAKDTTRHVFLASDRIRAEMPNHPVPLGQPLDLPITLAPGAKPQIFVGQGAEHGSISNEPANSKGKNEATTVVRTVGRTRVVRIIPAQIGRITLLITAGFADGGIAMQRYPLDVVASSAGLSKFYIDEGGHAIAIVLEDKEEDRQHWLWPEVQYKTLEYPIYLPDSSQVRFTVEQPANAPVIRLDPNGMVHGLRPGRARITADFAGVKDFVDVQVYTKESAPLGFRRER